MVSYFIFWIIQLPLLLIPPTKLRWLFIIKIVAAPITALATMGWCVYQAGGSGQIFQLQATLTGSAKAWRWLQAMSSVTGKFIYSSNKDNQLTFILGSWATLACNIPDFSRYAKSSKGQYIQLPFLPAIFTACAVIGIVTTSASYILYGQYLWNPLDILQHWLDDYGTSGARAAVFFAALSWYIAQASILQHLSIPMTS
jgi:NCS1 family nucleobase:cation symporter-1